VDEVGEHHDNVDLDELRGLDSDMDARKFNPAFGTEDGLAYELYGNKKPEVNNVKEWSKPPEYTSPWNQSSNNKNNKCDEVVDHLLIEKSLIDLVDEVRRDHKQGNKL
jgi:hypothetical protein